MREVPPLTIQLDHYYREQVVMELKVVLISHMHADHHLGLLRILAVRQDLLRQKKAAHSTTAPDAEAEEEKQLLPLLVVGPPALKEWLDEYASQIQELNYRFVPCHALNKPHHPIR
jgi:ribonuclease Z